jgi:carbon monoxide dehydrogenase subunit G
MTVAATSERVWRVLTSFEEMPAYLSCLKESKILKKDGTYRLVEQRARGGVAFLAISFRVVLEVIEDRPYLYFKQRNGSFTSFSGYWRVDPSLNENGSRIRYYLQANLGRGLRRRAFKKYMQRMIRQSMQELADWIDNSGG